MLIEVKSPEFSESVQSGTLLEWRKQPGDTVRRDETLADIETDKVVLEIPAPVSGRLVEVRIPAGTDVRAGDILAIVEADASAEIAVGAIAARVPTPVAPQAAPAPVPADAAGPVSVPAAPIGAAAAVPIGAAPPGEHLRPSARKHETRPGEPAAPAAAAPKPQPVMTPQADPAPVSAAPGLPPRGSRRVADEPSAPAHRRAHGRGPAHRRHPHHLQRNRHAAGAGTARPLPGPFPQGTRRQAGLHVLLRQGGHAGAQAISRWSTPASTAATSSITTTTTSASRSARSAAWWCRCCATPTP
jgi:pyruvate/2-oxoglutarate dehydrogenase complex dihydrolipoamide acyltransferase (E2) component